MDQAHERRRQKVPGVLDWLAILICHGSLRMVLSTGIMCNMPRQTMRIGFPSGNASGLSLLQRTRMADLSSHADSLAVNRFFYGGRSLVVSASAGWN